MTGSVAAVVSVAVDVSAGDSVVVGGSAVEVSLPQAVAPRATSRVAAARVRNQCMVVLLVDRMVHRGGWPLNGP